MVEIRIAAVGNSWRKVHNIRAHSTERYTTLNLACHKYVIGVYFCNDIYRNTDFHETHQRVDDDDEYRELQKALVYRPVLGDVIRDSGGLRKVRWKQEGRGKSGGVRVIYYWVPAADQIRMIYVYPKGKQENLTAAQLATLRKIIERWSNG